MWFIIYYRTYATFSKLYLLVINYLRLLPFHLSIVVKDLNRLQLANQRSPQISCQQVLSSSHTPFTFLDNSYCQWNQYRYTKSFYILHRTHFTFTRNISYICIGPGTRHTSVFMSHILNMNKLLSNSIREQFFYCLFFSNSLSWIT